MNPRLLKTLILAASVVAVGAALLPLLARPSNCGGNSYALAACKKILAFDRLGGGANGPAFDLVQLDAVDQTNFVFTVANHWTPDAGYWLRTNFPNNPAAKQIVVVCDRAYDNVPQPTVWNLYHRNPAHAVGYSDGTTGLITPVEFSGLDRSGFVSLTALATNHFR
jgi:hypothetical protein